jgi:hypothetical protein
MATRSRNTKALPVDEMAIKIVVPAKKKATPKTPAGTRSRKTTERSEEKSDAKVVRDGFTMPKNEYDRIKDLKAMCLKQGVAVKKSELLRAGLQALLAMSTDDLIGSVGKLSIVKVGRKKS